MSPQLQAQDISTGNIYLAPIPLAPRYNIKSFYVPKRNQFILYLFDQDADISLSSAYISFLAAYNNIQYEGPATNVDTFFSDLGFIEGMIFWITGSSSNNIKVSILSVIAGTPIGTTEYLSETDFATHAKWSETNDFDLTAGLFARWMYSADLTSELSQAKVDLASAIAYDTWYRLEYTITETVAPVDVDLEFYLAAGEMALNKTVLPHTAGTHVVNFYSSPSADYSAFNIYAEASSTGGSSAGTLDFDDISIKTMGTGEILKVSEDLVTEAVGNTVTFNQDPAGLGIVFDLLSGRFTKFKGMNIVAPAVMAGGDQLHNVNLFLNCNGGIDIYPDDDDGEVTTEDAYIEKTMDFYQVDLRKVIINQETDNDGEIEISINDELNARLTTKKKDILSTDNNMLPINMPRGSKGNKLTLVISKLDNIKYYILNYIKRNVRRT